MLIRLGKKKTETITTLIAYALLAVGVILSTFPYIWMVTASFKPEEEIYTRFIPTRITLENYMYILGGGGHPTRSFARAFLNSIIVTGIDTASVVFFGIITGYALSRLKFAGRKVIYNWVLYQMLFPSMMFLIPLFIIIINLGLTNTYPGMFLPFLMTPWATFLYAQFFRTIPESLIRAARIDGCSETGIALRIIAPLSMSITITVAVFTFILRWSDFLWDFIVVKDYSFMTLSVLLALIAGQRGVVYAPKTYVGANMAGATLLTTPIVIAFIVFRKYFIKGILMTGLKA